MVLGLMIRIGFDGVDHLNLVRNISLTAATDDDLRALTLEVVRVVVHNCSSLGTSSESMIRRMMITG